MGRSSASPQHTILSNAEIDAVLSVLWHTGAIRQAYEDRALFADERMWKNNGGLFPNHARYHSQKWQKMMGPDDPTVLGRRISQAAMSQARRDFENNYRQTVYFALELVDKLRTAVADAIKKKGPSEDGEYEEEVGQEAWEKITADPLVIQRLADLSGVTAGSVQL